MQKINEYLPVIMENGLAYGLNFIKALAIFFVGKFIIKYIVKFISKSMEKSGTDPMLSKFISNIAYALMLTFVIIAAISQLGVQTASLVAILGAAGLAVGIAYDADISKAREVILKAIAESDYVLDSPAASVGVTELADNSVNLTVRP